MDTHRAREDAWPSDSPLENPPPRPPVPKSFLRTLSLRSWESCWEVWPRGNRAILWVEGWASISPDRSLGTLCKWSDSSRVGNVTRGRLVDGGTECACANQVLARNQLALARRKAISWGPPHVLPRVKGDPFTDGRTAGYSHSWDPDGVAYGFASRWASGSQTGPRYLSPMVAEGCLLLDASVLPGQGTAWALSG